MTRSSGQRTPVARSAWIAPRGGGAVELRVTAMKPECVAGFLGEVGTWR